MAGTTGTLTATLVSMLASTTNGANVRVVAIAQADPTLSAAGIRSIVALNASVEIGEKTGHALYPALLTRPTLNQTCYTCHAEKRGPFLWEHAPVAEDCSNCHTPHGSVNPALLLSRPPLLCQQCHSQADHPSMAATGAGLARGQASSFLLAGSCTNCHSQVHGSNAPSGADLNR